MSTTEGTKTTAAVPAGPKDRQQVHIDLSAEEAGSFRQLASGQRKTVSALARDLLREAVRRHRSREEYRQAMDRISPEEWEEDFRLANEEDPMELVRPEAWPAATAPRVFPALVAALHAHPSPMKVLKDSVAAVLRQFLLPVPEQQDLNQVFSRCRSQFAAAGASRRSAPSPKQELPPVTTAPTSTDELVRLALQLHAQTPELPPYPEGELPEALLREIASRLLLRE